MGSAGNFLNAYLATHISALINVLARGPGAAGRGQQAVPAGAHVGAGRVAALAAAARPRALAALVDVAAGAAVCAEVPAVSG